MNAHAFPPDGRAKPQPLAYRPKDAAAVLGVSRAQIYRMIAAGTVTAHKLGGATLIRHEELVRVLDGAVLIDITKRPQPASR